MLFYKEVIFIEKTFLLNKKNFNRPDCKISFLKICIKNSYLIFVDNLIDKINNFSNK